MVENKQITAGREANESGTGNVWGQIDWGGVQKVWQIYSSVERIRLLALLKSAVLMKSGITIKLLLLQEGLEWMETSSEDEAEDEEVTDKALCKSI